MPVCEGVTGLVRRADPGSPAALRAVSGLETAVWTPAYRALVGDFNSGQVLMLDQFCELELLLPPSKPGGRSRSTEIRNLLDGLFYLVFTGCQ